MADFITQFPANEVVSRENFNSRISQANTALITIHNAAAEAQTTAHGKVSQIQNTSGGDANDLVPGTFGIAHYRAYGLIGHRPPGYSDENDFFITTRAVGVGWGVQIAYDIRNPKIFVRNYRHMVIEDPIVYDEWTPLATALPPQKYALSLASGWVRINAAEYCKTQDSVVTVTFRVARTGGATISSGLQQVATLPVGFRPVGYTPHIVASTIPSSVVAVCWVDENGVIWCNVYGDVASTGSTDPYGWVSLAATITFVAS